MSRQRTILVLLCLASVGVLVRLFLPPQQPAPHRHASRVPAPALPGPAFAAPIVTPPPEPAPHPAQPLPTAEVLSLPMIDGSPLRARWYPATQANAPIVVLDVGAGADLRPWTASIQALLAQRPAHVLWLDDVQPRHGDLAARQARALDRWTTALTWLDVRAPTGRLALVAAHDAADAVWRVATRARPLSLAVIAPDQAPNGPLPDAVLDRFTLVALPLADTPTPTWVAQLRNARVLPIAAAHALEDERVQADLSGWLFVALGPR